MKLLHLTDSHLGLPLAAQGPPDWSRADDAWDSFEAAVRDAAQADLILHTGDLFDRPVPAPPWPDRARARLEALADLAPVVVIPGNHEKRGLNSIISSRHPQLHLLDAPTRLQVAGLTLAAVPWCREATDFARAAPEATGPGADLLLAHQSFDGARVPGYTFRAGRRPDVVGPQHLPAGVNLILCGHLHERQVVRVGPALVLHPGSTVRTSFDEGPSPKSYQWIELGHCLRWTLHPLPERPLRVVSTEAALAQVNPGDLVKAPEELGPAVRARGAYWVVWRRPVERSCAPATSRPAAIR